MNLLFLSDGIYPFTIGGMQKYSSDLVKYFLINNCKITLVYCVYVGTELPKDNDVREKLLIPEKYFVNFKIVGLRFPVLNNLPGHYIKESYMFSKFSFDAVSSEIENYDFIYAQGFSGWYTLEQKQKNGKIPPIGVHFHGLNMFQKSYGLKAKVESIYFRKPVKKNLEMANVVFSYGGKFQEIYDNLGVGNKTMYQPIGIELNKISNEILPVKKPLEFIFIGRNDKIKGLDILLKAISKIPENIFKFNFIGDIPVELHLKRKDCNFTGVLNDADLLHFLSYSDVLLCPSYGEGMPYVVLEAMAKGLIIIASDVGAISEMVNQENGFLIPPGDYLTLKNTIEKLEMMSKEDLEILKKNSLKKSAYFDWELNIKNSLSSFRKIISTKL